MRTLVRFVILVGFGLCWESLTFAQQAQGAAPSTRSIARILGIPLEGQGKCGTSDMMLAIARWDQLTQQKRMAVVQALQRPQMQKDRLSPSGRFRIHYDTVGPNAPALLTGGSDPQPIPNSQEQYIDSVSYYFERAWKLEVDTLGYLPPPSDGIEGGGPEYDVYVEELGINLFGQTSWDPSAPPLESGSHVRYATYIEIDNDFYKFRTSGMDALRITSAHEFHHSIQVGNYGMWATMPAFDSWFYELTSVWMEHMAYPNIHDYYLDLPKYFQQFRDGLNRSYAFNWNTSSYAGYERSIWAHFLTKRFGRDVMKNIWTGIKTSPVLGSMMNILQQYGTTLESEFALFSNWNYFTADRADPQKYYDEGKNYPRFVPNTSSNFTGLSASISSSAMPLSTQFYQFVLTSDTITAILANTNVAGALDSSTPLASFQLFLSSTNLQAPYQKVARGLGLMFTTANPNQWKTQYLQSSTRTNANAAPDPSPNPLRLGQDAKLVLPVLGASGVEGEVFFVNSALELVFSRQYPVRESFGNQYIDVPTSDLRGTVATGVYFIMARCGEADFNWKIAIVR